MLDGAYFSLNTFWAHREALIAAALPKGMLKLKAQQCLSGLPACLAVLPLLEGSGEWGLICLQLWVLQLLGKKLPLFPKLPTLESHVLAFQGKDCVTLCLIWQCPSCEGSPKLLL